MKSYNELPEAGLAGTIEDIDRDIENNIREMLKRNVVVKYVALGQHLYLQFLEYHIRKTANSRIAAKKLRLFERVEDKRYPVRLDLNSGCPTSIVLVI